MGNALKLPEGFVFEDEQALPEGFVFEDAEPVFDPIAEDERIKASVNHAHKANLLVSEASLHHDSLERIEKKRPIGFVEGVTEDALFKIPFSGAAIEGMEIARLKIAAIKLNDEEFDWEAEAQRAKQRLEFRQRRAGLVPPMSEAEFRKKRAAITAESVRQENIDGVTGYITAMSERAERGRNVWGKIGSGLSVLPAWMVEFAMTAGLAQTASAPVKKFLQTHMKTKLLAKTAGWISGSVARTTVGMPHRVFANTMQQSLENDEGWATSIAKGWGETMIEVTSETAGEGIVGGARWVTGGVINRLPFGKKFLSALQKSWTRLSPDNTAAKFAKRVATKGGYNGLIGEFGEERLASLMHAVVGTETFGLPKGASIEDRLIAAVKQDLDASNLVSEAVVLSVPGAIKVSVAHLGQFADNKKLAKAIEEQVGVSPEVAKTAVTIKTKEGIEVADTYLSQVKTEGEAQAEQARKLEESIEEGVKAAPSKPVRIAETPAKPSEAAPLVAVAGQAVEPVAVEGVEPTVPAAAPAAGKQPFETSDLATSPNIPIGSIEAKKRPDGKWRLFFRGTRNEVFAGELFNSAKEAKDFFKVQKIKAQEAAAKPGVEEGAGGIAWQTAMKNVLALAEKDRPLVEKEQSKVRSQRVGAMAGTLEFLRKKGVPGKEAIHRASGQLKGALMDYEGRYQPLVNIIEPAFIQAAEDDIADNANLTEFDRLKLTNPDKSGAWDKMLRGASLTPSDVVAIRKWQPILAKEAQKRVPLVPRFWSGLERLLGTLKFGAGFDVQTRRQGRWLRGRHPVIFTKAVGRNVAAYISNEYADKMAAETIASPNHRAEAKFGAKRYKLKFFPRHPELSTERPEQFTTTIPTDLPFIGKVGKVHAASMRGFIDSFNWMQQTLWDWQIDRWKAKNAEITPRMLHDLADFQNTFLGVSKPKTNFGQAVNRVMRPVMWSPSLTWSRVRTPSLMLSNSTMRGEVAVSLSAFIGTGLMYLGAASMLARWWGKDVVEWDVDSSDFGKIKVGNTRWDVYGDGGPYIRALLQAWKGTKKNQAGRVTTKEGFDKLDPFKQLFRNKRAPAMDLFLKIWTGRNYYGGDAWALPDYDSMRREGGRKAEIADWHEKMMEKPEVEIPFFIGKEVYDRYMPFFIQSTVEAAWFDGWPQALGAGTDEFFSGQALTYEPSTSSELQILQDISATQEFNKLWDDLTPREQERLERQVPEMERLEIKKASEKLPPEEISLTKQNRAAKRIFKAMPDNVKKEMNAVGLKVSAPARKIGRFFLNEDRYKAYEEFTRQEIEASLTRRIETARWQTRSEVNRLKIMKDDMTNAKARARDRVLTAINRNKL